MLIVVLSSAELLRVNGLQTHYLADQYQLLRIFMFSELGEDFDGFDELSVARIRPYYNLSDMIKQIKASMKFYFIIPERSRKGFD